MIDNKKLYDASSLAMKRKIVLKKLFTGAKWSLIGGGIGQVLALTATILVARILGVESFGELGILQSTIGMFGVLAGFGLSLTLTKHIAQHSQSHPNKAGAIYSITAIFSLVMGGMLTIVLFYSSSWLADYALNASHLASLIMLFSPALIIDAWLGVQLGALVGFQSFKKIAVIEFVRGIVQFIAMLFGAIEYGLMGVVVALLISKSSAAIVATWAVGVEMKLAKIPLFGKDWRGEWLILIHFSLPAALSGLTVAPVIWVCNAMLVRVPGGYAELGLFNAANQIKTAISFVGSNISKPLLPLLAGDSERSKFVRLLNILVTWAIGVMITLPILIYPESVAMLFGSGYKGDGFTETIILMVLVTSITLYKEGIAREVVSNDLMWFSVGSNLTWGITMIIFTFFLSSFGARGLASSYLLAYVLNILIFVPFYLRKGIVPKNTLVSSETLWVWIPIVIGAASYFIELTGGVKVILLLASMISATYGFWCMARKKDE